MKKKKELGNIELSNKVVVSDSGYNRETWCMAADLAVRPGRYSASVIQSDEGEWGWRVANLLLVHEDFADVKLFDWESVSKEIGVDSGQCGIFDDSVYPQLNDETGVEAFYDECCAITLDDLPAGVLENGNGVVTSSGYGDGCYELFAMSIEGERVALLLDFKLLRMRDLMETICGRQRRMTI